MTLLSDDRRIQDGFIDNGWTDGLPIVAPTQAAVAAMLAEVSEIGSVEIGPIPPLDTMAPLENVAANAVMAGCWPEHFPTVLAAVRAMLMPEFNLYSMQTTTHPATPLIVVHGPEARRIGMHGKSGALGPGFHANAAIGRAIRLILMNLGGARPGVRDFATLGSPCKFTYCFTENMDDSPWPEFHTSRGFASTDSAVTVVSADAPITVSDADSFEPARMLDNVSSALSHLGSNNLYATQGSSNVVVVLCPEHASMAADAGWDRVAVQRYLYHSASKSPDDVRRGGMWEPRTWSPWMDALAERPWARIPVVESPEHILVLVAGGPGKFSAVMTTMGNVHHAVTVPI